MPQALIRKLTKDQVDKLVTDSKMPLSVEAHGKDLLVKTSAKVEDLPMAGQMALALQAIADADAEIIWRERKANDAEEAAKAAAAKAAAAPP